MQRVHYISVKSRPYAYLSYIGLVFPVLGIIFSRIALSLIRGIDLPDDEDDKLLGDTRFNARVGGFLSIVCLIFETIFIISFIL